MLPEYAETAPAKPPTVTDIRKDMADYDHRFGLPPAKIQVITALAGASASPWLASGEEVGDTEMVHVIAPGATIAELPVNAADLTTPAGDAASIATVVRTAVGHGAGVISFSIAAAEHKFTSAACPLIMTRSRLRLHKRLGARQQASPSARSISAVVTLRLVCVRSRSISSPDKQKAKLALMVSAAKAIWG